MSLHLCLKLVWFQNIYFLTEIRTEQKMDKTHHCAELQVNTLEAFSNYVDKMKGRGGQKLSVFVHAQGIKSVHAEGEGVKK